MQERKEIRNRNGNNRKLSCSVIRFDSGSAGGEEAGREQGQPHHKRPQGQQDPGAQGR